MIADWLHNLALYSARDFERFEEESFWDCLRFYEQRYPDFELIRYIDLFERELSREEDG
ncbi:hypothetical protein LOC68_18565 [Blastopirellula sp. JC732]|uniref:Uncharacterized protein n=1 Tax=Blastopirellula sediminis TaxID=2894196 RepID=A0A9X1SHR6_9BACT|nr:hypothetical protein [Blastopirellula sediminis]MCC9606300.1 hypothetical protein [Blastopirellula sediminis]MCC9630402.1 hypothetical protein [Blastopirellula sediminis]